MSYKLVIVESPAKAKTIEKYLGENFRVTASMGHIRDLAKSGKGGLGIDLETFEPHYTTTRDKQGHSKTEVINELKALAKGADHVYIATDPDREGEAIAWHIKEVLGLDEERYNRVVFNEITPDAVVHAVENPRKIDMALVHSQETRRMLDRIVGFKLSNLVKKKVHSESAGRVQSAAVKMIVDRERERNAFVPVVYHVIDAKTKIGGNEIELQYPNENPEKIALNKDIAETMADGLNGKLEVTKIEAKKTNGRHVMPFTTSTLQQNASSRYGFSASQTMKYAQELYEGLNINGKTAGIITYMRTDSLRLSPVFLEKGKDYIEQHFGADHWEEYHSKEVKNSQDAHEAIRPATLHLVPEEIKSQLPSPNHYKIYKMIYERALAAMMKPPVFDKTHITLMAENGTPFKVTGSQIVFDGYYKAIEKDAKDLILPKLEEGQTFNLYDVHVEEKQTTPPSRFGEASLIKLMEENGVGRPSTYASTMSTIKDRNYVELENKSFVPTESGIETTEFLEKNFKHLVTPEFTAQMEHDLDNIAHGKDHIELLKEFYSHFEKEVDEAMESNPAPELKEVGEDCPLCGKPLVVRKSRFGAFHSCSGFPDCKFTRSMSQTNFVSEKTGEYCPVCFSEIITKQNRSGQTFKACSNFPKCKWTIGIEEKVEDNMDKKAAEPKKGSGRRFFKKKSQ